MLISSMLILFSCHHTSSEIYVALNGHDTSAGSKENPLRTIEKACELAKSVAGKEQVTILLEDGVYYLNNTLQFTAEHSGNERYPVIVKAVNDGKAIISWLLNGNLFKRAY